MLPVQSPFVSVALSRLLRAVSACCWVAAGALAVQVFIWCMAHFTQVRYDVLESQAQPGAIVSAHDKSKAVPTAIPAVRQNKGDLGAPTTGVTTADPNRVLSRFDPMLSNASAFAKAAGTLSIVMLLPLLGLGVLLGASSASPGVEKTVSAFTWSIVISVLVLPCGDFLGLPWHEGALTSYGLMTSQVDQALTASSAAVASATYFATFAVLPLACIAGLAMIGLRFSAGVSAGIIPKESLRLDPALEKEAANIKPGSLHGARAGNAMRSAGMAGATTERKLVTASTAAPVAAGEAPRRLI